MFPTPSAPRSYLRKNDVKDLHEIQHLAGLQHLRVLWLSDNPCADHPNYKQFVARTLPQLHKLDNDDIGSMYQGAGGDGAGGPPAPPARSGSGAPPPGAGAGAGSAGPSPYGTPQIERGSSRGSAGVSPEGGPAGGYAAARAAAAAGGGGGGGRSTKNILYAVMALLGELEDEDLVYVRREIEQRIGGR